VAQRASEPFSIYAWEEGSELSVFGGGFAFFLVGCVFSFSGAASTVATGLGGGAGAGLARGSLVIAIAASPIPRANAPPMPSAIVAYSIVLSVLHTAITVRGESIVIAAVGDVDTESPLHLSKTCFTP